MSQSCTSLVQCKFCVPDPKGPNQGKGRCRGKGRSRSMGRGKVKGKPDDSMEMVDEMRSKPDCRSCHDDGRVSQSCTSWVQSKFCVPDPKGPDQGKGPGRGKGCGRGKGRGCGKGRGKVKGKPDDSMEMVDEMRSEPDSEATLVLGEPARKRAKHTTTKEAEVSEELKVYGPPAAPWLQGNTWKGVRYPKDERLKLTVLAKKEAHCRRKLQQTASDDVWADAAATKAQALEEAALSLKAVGFFRCTRTADVAVWDQAYTEWVQAENLLGAAALLESEEWQVSEDY